MARTRTTFVCQQCEYSQVGWAGRCPNCNSWNSLVETVSEKTVSRSGSKSRGTSTKSVTIETVQLFSVSVKKTSRQKTKISELDRVLGGGLVGGQVVLIAGEPGIGKSTILLQISDKMGEVVYVSGEESVYQIGVRAKRLGINSKTIQAMEETNLDSIIASVESMENKPSLLVIDSIQTVYTNDLSGMAGSVGQVRECTYRLVRLAKSQNITVFVVGHVTKQGSVAGPAVLAHLVDTVLWFEGEKSLSLRLLRANKNRFGPTDEVGIFSMTDRGLEPVGNIDKIFLSGIRKRVAGSAITSVVQGTRPILVEVQALVVPSKLAFPRRVVQGIDSKRLELLLAVLVKRCGLPLGDFDCFINIAAGINIKETGADLAICMSVASSYMDKPLPASTLVVGEVGLLGDIRQVPLQERRIKEAKRLGYRNIISNREVKYLKEAITRYLR